MFLVYNNISEKHIPIQIKLVTKLYNLKKYLKRYRTLTIHSCITNIILKKKKVTLSYLYSTV